MGFHEMIQGIESEKMCDKAVRWSEMDPKKSAKMLLSHVRLVGREKSLCFLEQMSTSCCDYLACNEAN